jgi:PLP dependent protein
MFQELVNTITNNKARLVAVSKTQPLEKIQTLYNLGQRIFGENRVPELVEKFEALPKDIEWHLIGHLQTNKVKYIAPFVTMIHSVDSIKLLNEIEKEARKNNRRISVLLQFHIAQEDTKFGLDLKEATELLDTYFSAQKDYTNVVICGIMGMATFTDNKDQVRQEFAHLKNIFIQLKETYFGVEYNFTEISMGMSGDYSIALMEGSTLVRIGSLLFK